MIAETAKVYPNVRFGKNVRIEDFCIVGCPAADGKERETVIGDDSVLRSHTVVYAGNIIGKHFQTGHKANIREDNRIGDNVSIGTLSVIEHHVEIEDGVRIHTQAFIPEYSILRKDSWIGPNVVFTNAKFPRSPDVKGQLKGPEIHEGAKIGANSTLLPGVVIGRNALVGAGSVVTHDVPGNAIVAGNPARKIRDIHY